jgi:hypothetical protein
VSPTIRKRSREESESERLAAAERGEKEEEEEEEREIGRELEEVRKRQSTGVAKDRR